MDSYCNSPSVLNSVRVSEQDGKVIFTSADGRRAPLAQLPTVNSTQWASSKPCDSKVKASADWSSRVAGSVASRRSGLADKENMYTDSKLLDWIKEGITTSYKPLSKESEPIG